MPDTYNPNEIFKLKHGYILANQIAQGILDLKSALQQFDPSLRANYPITRMDWIDNSSGSTVTTTFTVNNPVINAKTNSFGNKQFQIRVQVPYISAPTISSSSENWAKLKMQYGFVSAASLPVNTWVIALYTTQESITVENFNVTLHFDGNAQYKPFDLTISCNITAAA